VGASQTELSDGKTLVLETILTVILVSVILNTASRHSLIGTDAAIAVGATIALCGLFAGTLTGASMNPARSFGPYVASGHADKLWLYVFGPLAGAIIAVLFSMLLHPRHDRDEREAAEGRAN
jgi:aquaporin Z